MSEHEAFDPFRSRRHGRRTPGIPADRDAARGDTFDPFRGTDPDPAVHETDFDVFQSSGVFEGDDVYQSGDIYESRGVYESGGMYGHDDAYARGGGSAGRRARRRGRGVPGDAEILDPPSTPPAPVLRARLKNKVSAHLPRTHARSLAQLRAVYPGLGPDDVAQQLVADAGRDSAAVGAAAACCAFVPVPGARPLAMTGESAAASALRTRLTAELHTVYGLLDPSPVNQGGTGHLAQWMSRDAGGAASLAAVPALALAATRALPGQLRRHLPRVRVLFTVSAVTAGLRSGRATRRYGERLRRDLRNDPTSWSRWPDEAHEPQAPGEPDGPPSTTPPD